MNATIYDDDLNDRADGLNTFKVDLYPNESESKRDLKKSLKKEFLNLD